MPGLVPPTLLNLAGLAGTASDPHIGNGNHLRVAHNPLFGLPVAPFILQRAVFETLPDGVALRRDVVFRNAANQVLTLPIAVKKGDRIRAQIIQGAGRSCILVAMTTVRATPVELRPPVILHRPNLGGVIRPAPVADRINPARLGEVLSTGPAASAAVATLPGQFIMRAHGASVGQGPALLGERRAAPYSIAAPGIVEVEITGLGTLTDFVWLADVDTEKLRWQSFEVMALPHADGARYLSVTAPRDRAEGKLRDNAPKRRPLQETLGATTPAAAAPFTPAEESQRVHALADPLDADLDALINGPDLPLVARETIAVTDAAGNSLAPAGESHIEISHLSRVLQGALDPGVAAWLGYKARHFLGVPDALTFYRVIGFFRQPASLGATPKDLQAFPGNAIPLVDRQYDAQVLRNLWMKLAGQVLASEGRQLTGNLAPAGDYVAISAVCAVNPLAVPQPPDPPVMLPPEHAAWLPPAPPALPSAALREVDCPLSGVLIQATLAAEREQPVPGSFHGLNRPAPAAPWHALLGLGLTSTPGGQPIASADGRQGVVSDRAAGAGSARYHVAQQDRFGRWSAFSSALAAPGPRPKPPRPSVQGGYTPPAIAQAATTGGRFALRVPLPGAASLAPGAFPLAKARLSFRHVDAAAPDGPSVAMPDIEALVSTAIVTEASPPAGQPPARAVPVTLVGPILAPTAQRRMIVTAVWIDSAGQVSHVSEPLRLMMTDPRPPAQLSIPDVLLYSSRPDATGLAFVERGWPVPAVNPPAYAAYYTDEIRLVAWLKEQGRDAEAIDIAATADRAVRAGKLRAIQADFPDHLFERLPGAVVAPSATERRLRHAVSGSSRVLNAYKIAVEAPGSGARPVLAGLDMVFYGVPNSDPPPRPVVKARLVEPQAGEPPVVCEVTITLEAAATPGVMARLYRTRGPSPDAMHAPVVADLALSAPDPVTGRQTATLRDTGTAQVAPTATLGLFARYQWFAAVQGAPESGSAVPGLWSLPSDPASLPTVPLAPPAAPVFISFGGTAVAGGTRDLTIAISHPLNLAPTALGSWRYEVLRAAPGDVRFSPFASGEVPAGPLVIADSVAGTVTPSASSISVRLYDPIGRPTPVLALVAS